MASFLDKFKINTAITENTTLDLSCQHITTTNFMDSQPVYIKEMVPGEKISIKQETFARMASMPVPTYGRCMIHNKAFFVPMRTIWRNWDNFITNTYGVGEGTDGYVQMGHVPVVTNEDLVVSILGGQTILHDGIDFRKVISNGTVWCPTATTGVPRPLANAIEVQGTDAYDIACVFVNNQNGSSRGSKTIRYFRLNQNGRIILKQYQSLGYEIVWSVGTLYVGTSGGSANYVGLDVCQRNYSALPLLAFGRIFIDWYVNAQYAVTGRFAIIRDILENYKVQKNPNATGYISTYELGNLMWTQAQYDSDYFVSAWDNPVAPVATDTLGNLGMKDITKLDRANQQFDGNPEASEDITTEGNGTPMIDLNNNQDYTISQYALDALKSLTDYMKRHQLVGARAMERFYARFGKALPAEKLNRCIYLGGDNIPVQFGDVFSSADTEQARLGDYAGKGLAFGGNGVFEYSTDEFGYIIIVSTIIPKVGYYGGQDRMTWHVNATDFWTPEFDSLGTQAVGKAELFVPLGPEKTDYGHDVMEKHISSINMDLYSKAIFGFMPRYAEYKVGRDKLTGDFRRGSVNVAGDTSDSWHLFRNPVYGLWQGNLNNLVHTLNFVQGGDGSQYDRIFNDNNDDTDKFYLIHNFTVTSQSPMKSLFDNYDFEDKGKKVVVDANGVRMN